MKFNGKPTKIPLGLLSESQDIEDIELVNGTCFQYGVHSFNRCKYYSDCCLMISTKPMEQLAYNTFSCHDNFYIVDKCPQETPNKELKALCEDFSSTESDLSLKRWPVRGLVNHLTYKNVFCAMCNGIDPQASVRFSDQIWFGDPNKINDSVSTMEWWPAKVECSAEAIEEYLCSIKQYLPPLELVDSVRRCKYAANYVASCPKHADIGK
ncbi:hypothetical protein EB796_003358 [Bugula neritina]|uniref:Uncharacterized protein n=1 Tax=Bugula neritina TaxID=10212 RepID=A0A7J7KI38_BUGNE|nr:hypothetical protein EB796_003358 [Bugula neritina]